jgi:hypothetical protein
VTDAVRNYILSHSQKVCEQSYQANDMHSLMEKSLGGIAEGTQSCLSLTRHALAKADPNAPVWITKAEWDGFENRETIIELREQLKNLPTKSPEAARIRRKISHEKDRCEVLLIRKKRDEYFRKSARLRESGLPTHDLVDKNQKDHHARQFYQGNEAAVYISTLLKPIESLWQTHSRAFETIVLYVKGSYNDIKCLSGTSNFAPPELDRHPESGPRCYLGCNSHPFASKATLKRHIKTVHKPMFKANFDCPECLLKGTRALIHSEQAWYSHVTRFHGKSHAPTFSNKNSKCHYCGKFFTARGLAYHTMNHVKKGDFLSVQIEERSSSPESAEGMVGYPEDPEEEVQDWRPPTPDPHADEEYWVTGRDEDYDFDEDGDYGDA